MPQYDVTLRDYWRILRKRKIIVIFATFMLSLTSFATALVSKPTPEYKATAKVQYEGKSSTPQEAYIEALGTEDALETEQAVITSYAVMQGVAQRIGFIDTATASDEERIGAILKLQGIITKEAEGLTNIISISATHTDRFIAQAIADTTADEYAEYNFRSRNAQKLQSLTFIKIQRDTVESQLKNAQRRLKQFQEETNIISLDTQTGIVMTELNRAQNEFSRLNAVYQSVGQILETYNAQGGTISERALASIPPEEAGPLFNQLSTQLQQMNQERNRLLINWTEQHPAVKDLDSRKQIVVDNMVNSLRAQQGVMAKRLEHQKTLMETLQKKYQRLPELGLRLDELMRNIQVQATLLESIEEAYQTARIVQSEEVRQVTILQKALLPKSPTNPSTPTTTAGIGALLGLILGVVFAFVAETLDTSIGTIEDVEEYVEASVVGIIPQGDLDDMKDAMIRSGVPESDTDTMERRMRLASHFEPRSTLAESYRALRTNIQFANLEKGAKLISMTSASNQEGKSTTIANLAVTLAQAGNRVLLIDGDLRRPTVARIFGLEREPGITDVILGNYSWREVIRTITDIMVGGLGMDDIMKTPGLDNLNIITCGTIPPNPSEIIDSRRMDDFLKEVRDLYDIVLVDSPPVLQATDATILGTKVDGVLLVYKIGQVSRSALRRAKLQLDNVHVTVLGVVINGLRAEVSEDFQDLRYYSYYSYGTETDEDLGPPLQRFYNRYMRKFKEFKEQADQYIQPVQTFVREKFGRDADTDASAEFFEDEDEGSGMHGTILRILLWVLLLLFLSAGVLWQIGLLRPNHPVAPGPPPLDANPIAPNMPFQNPPATEPQKPLPVDRTQKENKLLLQQTKNKRVSTLETPKIKPTAAPQKSALLPAQAVAHPEQIPQFAIHVASHKTLASANRAAKTYQKRQYHTQIKQIHIPNRGQFYRILVGQYTTRKEAHIAAQKLKSQGLTAYTAIAPLPKPALLSSP